MASSAYTVAEVAEMTGVSKTSVYLELEQTGEVLGVPGLKIRSRWVLPRRPIDQKLGIEVGAA